AQLLDLRLRRSAARARSLRARVQRTVGLQADATLPAVRRRRRQCDGAGDELQLVYRLLPLSRLGQVLGGTKVPVGGGPAWLRRRQSRSLVGRSARPVPSSARWIMRSAPSP